MIPSLAVSASTSIPAPPFARTAQAAHLLSRVLRHLDDQPGSGSTAEAVRYWYVEALALGPVVEAFGRGLQQELDGDGGAPSGTMQLFAAAGLCHSARVALYDAHTCAEADAPQGVGIPEQLQMQAVALEGMKEACGDVLAFARRVGQSLVGGERGARMEEGEDGEDGHRWDHAEVSPLVCNCLYESAKNYSWYMRETGRADLGDLVREIYEVLRKLGRTWKVAGKSARQVWGF